MLESSHIPGNVRPHRGEHFRAALEPGGALYAIFAWGVFYSRPPTNLLFLKEVNDVEDVQWKNHIKQTTPTDQWCR